MAATDAPARADLVLRGRRKALRAGGLWGFGVLGGRRRGGGAEETGGGVGGGFRGVDDTEACGDGGFNERPEQGIVGAAEDEGVGLEARGGSRGEELVEVDADDLLGDGHLRHLRRGRHLR